MEYNGLELLFILGFELPEKYVINKEQINIYFFLSYKVKITLDKDKRIILPLNDATIIQIKRNEIISGIKSFLPYNAFNKDEIFNRKINLNFLGFINNNLYQIYCKLEKYDKNHFELSQDINFYNLDNFVPLLLIDDKKTIIGILDKKNITGGTFVWFYLEALEKYRGNQTGIYRYNIDNNIDVGPNINNELIKHLDYILNNKEAFFNFIKIKKNSEFYVKASIFVKEKYNNYKIEFNNKYKNKQFSEIEKSCIGSMVGMAIGDAMGARVEFLPLNYEFNKVKDMGNGTGGKFKLEPGQWTDDTSMGLCIADSLIEKKGEFNARDIMMRFVLWWFCGYNNAFRLDHKRENKHSVGLGGNISESIYQFVKSNGKYEYTISGDKNTSGNGSIMRNGAIPICYFKDGLKALENAKKQSLTTHQGNEAAGCCQLMTFIIIKILKAKIEYLKKQNNINSNNKNQYSLASLLDNLKDFNSKYPSVNYLAQSRQEGTDKNRNWNWKDNNFRYSEYRAKRQPGYIGSYCMDALAMALHILYTTDNFKDAMLKAVNLCGDADSLGSIVGQIAGAYYGLDSIPENWINTLNKWDNNEIALRGYILCNLNNK